MTVHRVAWMIFYGEWPNGCIDHVNGDTFDNRISNLRLATHSQNMANTRNRRSSTGFRGVRPTESGTFEAQIKLGGRNVHLGTFKTPQEAAEAFRQAAVRAHGEFSFFSRPAV
jgi:hypothetical protein